MLSIFAQVPQTSIIPYSQMKFSLETRSLAYGQAKTTAEYRDSVWVSEDRSRKSPPPQSSLYSNLVDSKQFVGSKEQLKRFGSSIPTSNNTQHDTLLSKSLSIMTGEISVNRERLVNSQTLMGTHQHTILFLSTELLTPDCRGAIPQEHQQYNIMSYFHVRA